MRIEKGVKGVIYNLKTLKYLLLMRSSTEDVAPGSYDFPGGGIDAGELPKEALKREIMEETGITIDNDIKQINTWAFQVTPNIRVDGITFLCFTQQEKVVLSEEHAMFEWVSSSDVVDNPLYPAWLKSSILDAQRKRIEL